MTPRSADDRHREVYISPYDLASLAQIISSSTDECDRWDVYITIGCAGNYIFGPYRVEINTSHRVWRIQSAETVYDLHIGNGCTEEEGDMLGCSAESIFYILKKVSHKWASIQ